MSFIQRSLEFTFGIGTGAGGATPGQTVTISGVRALVTLSAVGGRGMGEAHCRILGLSPNLLNQLSALNGADMIMRNNTITIAAGDTNNAPSTIFQGGVALGQLDFINPPEAALTVVAYAALYQANATAQAVNYPNGGAAEDMMQSLATQMGLNFDNTAGVHVVLPKSNFTGSLRDQAQAVADAARINWAVENGVLVIWTPDTVRQVPGDIPLISPANGLIGYPSYSDVGIAVRCQFRPTLRIAALVQVQSSIPVMNGQWKAFQIAHTLESQQPNGRWETQFLGSRYAAS